VLHARRVAVLLLVLQEALEEELRDKVELSSFAEEVGKRFVGGETSI